MNDLPIEGPIRERSPDDKGGMGDVGGGRVSQSPFVAVHEIRAVRKEIVRDEEPFFPAGAVLGDLERVNADLGLEEWSGSWAAGEGDGVIARAVHVHCRFGVRRGAFGRYQGREDSQEETEMNENQHRAGSRLEWEGKKNRARGRQATTKKRIYPVRFILTFVLDLLPYIGGRRGETLGEVVEGNRSASIAEPRIFTTFRGQDCTANTLSQGLQAIFKVRGPPLRLIQMVSSSAILRFCSISQKRYIL